MNTEVLQHYAQFQIREQAEPVRQVWCSFCDTTLPQGEQFLGVVVVNARGPATATAELNAKGLNLGGQIMFVDIPSDQRIPDDWTYRVLNKMEAENCPYEAVE